MLAYITDACFDQVQGIAAGTAGKQHSDFKKWIRFLQTFGLEENEFLEGFSIRQQNILLSAFGACIRRNKFGTTSKEQLVGGSVATALSNVSTTFRIFGYRNPMREEDGGPCLAIARQIRGYKDSDPSIKHQACIPLIVFSKSILALLLTLIKV